MDKVDFTKLKTNFLALVEEAGNLKTRNADLKPVFSEVPAVLKNFAAKVTDKVNQLKAKLTFDFLDEDKELRSKGLGDDNNKNIVTITNWMVSAVKQLIDSVEQQGEIITVHTEALAKPHDALLVAKNDEIKKLQSEVQELTKEVDETRQRGIKGNLIISSPENGRGGTLATPKTVGGKVESNTDMVIRLIQQKTGVVVEKKDIIACHPMGKKKESHAFVIRLASRQEGSAWEILTEGMRTGKNASTNENFSKDNVYINYQLTNKRGKLAMAIRKAKSAETIHKYYINQNGVIKVKKTSAKEDKYIEVTSEAHLNSIINT